MKSHWSVQTDWYRLLLYLSNFLFSCATIGINSCLGSTLFKQSHKVNKINWFKLFFWKSTSISLSERVARCMFLETFKYATYIVSIGTLSLKNWRHFYKLMGFMQIFSLKGRWPPFLIFLIYSTGKFKYSSCRAILRGNIGRFFVIPDFPIQILVEKWREDR